MTTPDRDKYPFFNKADLSLLETYIKQLRAAKGRAGRHGEEKLFNTLVSYLAKLEGIRLALSAMLGSAAYARRGVYTCPACSSTDTCYDHDEREVDG